MKRIEIYELVKVVKQNDSWYICILYKPFSVFKSVPLNTLII